jgi:hypothetical protein
LLPKLPTPQKDTTTTLEFLSLPNNPQIMTHPAPSCPPIQHHSNTHSTGISETPEFSQTTDIAICVVHHKPPNTLIHPNLKTTVDTHTTKPATTTNTQIHTHR